MPGDTYSRPYTRSARHASMKIARRNRQEDMLADAEDQQQMGRRAIARSRRDLWVAWVLSMVLVVVTAVCFWQGGTQRGYADEAANRAWWWMLGGTLALGAAYFVSGGIHRARQRSFAGRRLLLRAQRQLERAGKEQP